LRRLRFFLFWALAFSTLTLKCQEAHERPAEGALGKVSFPVSCTPRVQEAFNQAVALMHSFAYEAAERQFEAVAKEDPPCAMAHWGAAMTHFHELWDPPIPEQEVEAATKEIHQAQELKTTSKREQLLIHAVSLLFENSESIPYEKRAQKYEEEMGKAALEDPKNIELQVFWALANLANASPRDKTHRNQKEAAAILEPLFVAYPEHPGIAHYLIHACDNAEMAERGLAAARAYSRIAPAAPHALHMPSHIFTRLGLWDDSIASNLAAKEAAGNFVHGGDEGEELHAMDYLVYAFLQNGDDQKAQELVTAAGKREAPNWRDYKAAYAYVAMPIRFAVERGKWEEAAKIEASAAMPPHVEAIAVWARGMGLAKTGHAGETTEASQKLTEIARKLREAGNEYWSIQTQILGNEVNAWRANAEGNGREAEKLLREAAEKEDGVEKLPVTPGPIWPAREQLGYLLVEKNKRAEAKKEFEKVLAESPGRRGAIFGLQQAEGMLPRQ